MAMVRLDMRAPKVHPAAKYSGVLLEPDVKPAKEGKEYGSVVFTFVTEIDGDTVKLQRYFSTSPKAVFFLQQALEALQVPYTVEKVHNPDTGKEEDVLLFNTDDVEGKNVIADVTREKGTDGRFRNGIAAFYLDV